MFFFFVILLSEEKQIESTLIFIQIKIMITFNSFSKLHHVNISFYFNFFFDIISRSKLFVLRGPKFSITGRANHDFAWGGGFEKRFCCIRNRLFIKKEGRCDIEEKILLIQFFQNFSYDTALFLMVEKHQWKKLEHKNKKKLLLIWILIFDIYN